MRSGETDQTGRLHSKVAPNLTSTGIDYKYGCRLHTKVAPYLAFIGVDYKCYCGQHAEMPSIVLYFFHASKIANQDKTETYILSLVW